MKRSVKEMTTCAALCAVLCVVCPFTVPVGVIPVTLASFAVCCIGGAAGMKKGLIATAVYLLIGALGVPVFAGFRGGVYVLTGPTGGYLFGYLLLAAAAGFVSDHTDSKAAFCGGFCAGTALLYLCGGGWYALSAKLPLSTAVVTGVLPFLPFDAVKIAAAVMMSPKLRKTLRSISA